MNNARTPLFYMANLGAEVSRLLSFRAQGDTARADACLARTQAILVKIAEFPEMRSRTPEIDILKQAIVGTISIPSDQLKAYFVPFALRITA